MPTTTILGYCVFDKVIDLADEAVTSAIEAEMESSLNGTGANYTVVTADVSDSSAFEGPFIFCQRYTRSTHCDITTEYALPTRLI